MKTWSLLGQSPRPKFFVVLSRPAKKTSTSTEIGCRSKIPWFSPGAGISTDSSESQCRVVDHQIGLWSQSSHHSHRVHGIPPSCCLFWCCCLGKPSDFGDPLDQDYSMRNWNNPSNHPDILFLMFSYHVYSNFLLVTQIYRDLPFRHPTFVKLRSAKP